MSFKEYLLNWFDQHGDEKYENADEWIDAMTNSDFVMWVDFYQQEKDG